VDDEIGVKKSQNKYPAKKAAMYVRMSTDHQKYSTQNQAEVIRKYADDRNLDIIKTYAEFGGKVPEIINPVERVTTVGNASQGKIS